MSPRTLAVVVTYNRCVLLSRCLEHLQREVSLPDSILVINNGSIDETEAMLRDRGIRYVTQENVGSAGGWHLGIQCALDEGFDAVWLMDDDGFPGSGALAALKASMSPGVSCASSVVLREDRPTHFVFPFPLLNAAGQPVIFRRPRNLATLVDLRHVATDGIYPFAHLFNGALVSLAAVRRIGNVNRDYFIYGDEVDYFFRLRKAGSVISVLNAMHYHPDVSNRPFSPAKVYYYVKNSLVLNARYHNAVWVRHALLLVAILGRMGKRNGIVFVFSLLMGRYALVFYTAVFRGLKGKIGKDFHG